MRGECQRQKESVDRDAKQEKDKVNIENNSHKKKKCVKEDTMQGKQ